MSTPFTLDRVVSIGRYVAVGGLLLTACLITACGDGPGEPSGSSSNEEPTASVDSNGHTPASKFTLKANRTVAEQIARLETGDLQSAMRGFIAAPSSLRIPSPLGVPAWDRGAYDFIQGAAPDTVNPSLWRQESLNNLTGLFQVTEGVFQLRGFDLANMTLISGERGWIVVDPLTTTETSAAALAFAFEHLPSRPISTIIFTHSHIDHFGGVFGVVTPEAVASGEVQIVAPVGFVAEATSEMVLAGRVMGRRADYMYGRRLARSDRGHVGSGIGKQPALGTMTIATPTLVITDALEEHRIDGVPMVFKNVPHSEAPAELLFYMPEQRALCGSELVLQSLHNLYTLRGAKVRDALLWSAYIDQAMTDFPGAELLFNSHHWPIWGEEETREHLKKQRDLYKYIHDQTLRLAGQGMTPDQIAEAITLPPTLQTAFHTRDYYGTIKHNARAVYQFYFGWYDANPAHLDSLPAGESAPKYVELMGGSGAVMLAARAAFDAGEYRWAAELLNKLVFAEPTNQRATSLLAATYDQLGYQAESGPWRDVYLSGAYELRHGAPDTASLPGDIFGLLKATPIERIFELMAAMLNGPDAVDVNLTVNFNFTDLQRNYVLTLENAVLHHRLGPVVTEADVTVNLTHDVLLEILLQRASLGDLLTEDNLMVEGSKLDLIQLLALLDPHSGVFNIVTP